MTPASRLLTTIMAAAVLPLAGCDRGTAVSEPASVPPEVRALRIVVLGPRPGSAAQVGDTLVASVLGVDAAGYAVPSPLRGVEWALSDSTLATLGGTPAVTQMRTLALRAPGRLTLRANIGRITGQDSVRILPRDGQR